MRIASEGADVFVNGSDGWKETENAVKMSIGLMGFQ
jgi:hypothetical protein